jgi:hypothetical protein
MTGPLDTTTGFPERPLLVFTRKYGWVVTAPQASDRPYLRLRHTYRHIPMDDVLECWDLPPVPQAAA